MEELENLNEMAKNRYLERANEWCRSEEKRLEAEKLYVQGMPEFRMVPEGPTEAAGEFKYPNRYPTPEKE